MWSMCWDDSFGRRASFFFLEILGLLREGGIRGEFDTYVFGIDMQIWREEPSRDRKIMSKSAEAGKGDPCIGKRRKF